MQGLAVGRHCALEASPGSEASGFTEASGASPVGWQNPFEQSPLPQSESWVQEVLPEGVLPQWQPLKQANAAMRARGLDADMSHLPSKALEFVGFRVVSPSGPSVSLRTTAAP